MAKFLTSTPALLPAICIATGIASGFFIWPVISSTAFFFLIFVGIVLFIFLKRFRRCSIFGLSFLCIIVGLWLGNTAVPKSLPEEILPKAAVITGKVDKVVYTPNSMRLFIDVSSWRLKNDTTPIPTDFKALAVLNTTTAEILPGSTIQLNGTVRPLDHTTDLPYEPDYNRFLYIDGVVARVYGFDNYDYTIDNSNVTSTRHFIHSLNQSWQSAIAYSGFDEETTVFLIAVIGGNHILLSEDMEEQFREAGISHILAISGMHIAIILAFFALILYPIKLLRQMRNIYFLLLAILVIGYAFVTGGSPSACRAMIMCCVLMGDKILEVRPNALQSLSVAVIILLCINPTWLFLPGFQFSVCAVLGIILFQPLLNIVPVKRPLLRAVWATFILPVVAVAGTLILTLYYFHTFTLSFWLSNIWAAIFVPPIIIIGFCATLLNLIGLSSSLLTYCGDSLFSLMQSGIDVSQSLMPRSEITIFLNVQNIIIIVMGLILISYIIRHYRKKAPYICLLCFTAIVCCMPSMEAQLPETELYIPRSRQSTDIIIVDNGKSYLWTSNTDNIAGDLKQNQVSTRYRHFFANRKTSAIPEKLDCDTVIGNISVRRNMISCKDLAIYIADSNDLPNDNCKADIVIVTESYNGSMKQLRERVNADSVLLSPAIHFSRHEKFVRQLDTIPGSYRSLRDKGFAWRQ
ncbi:MAG: ComEC/Rec2 family competence protein [Muribaculaceae bacterium]|nr:ComEC/Rec2 family competence protein [Muribaculaceae bacterium]